MASPSRPLISASRPSLGTRFLRRFFSPASLLLVGSTNDDGLASVVLDNLLEGGFPGALYALDVRPGRVDASGVTMLADLAAVTDEIELAVACVPIGRTPALLEALGRHGVRAVILLRDDDAGDVERSDLAGVRERLSEIALRLGIRVIGPDCLGVAVPEARLNATFAAEAPLRGRLAYLGQSGMLGAAINAWSRGRGIGLSHLITLGDSVDVRLSDMLDFVSQRTRAQAILLHIERITDARHFVTALREASKRRLVLAIGGSRSSVSERLGVAPTPGIPHRAMILDAALRRAGTVRIEALDDIYDSLEVLTRIGRGYRGPRLMIVGNGLAPSLLAADALVLGGGAMAEPSERTQRALIEAGLLAEGWPTVPLDLGGAARPEAFATAVRLLLADPGVDALLVLHAPTRLAGAVESAEALIEAAAGASRPVLAAWMGHDDADEIQQRFARANLASFSTPERAVRAFLRLEAHRQAQAQLWETPALAGFATSPSLRARAQALIERARARGRESLTHEETGQVLNAYGIGIAQSEYVQSAQEGMEVARRAFGALAVKAVHAEHCLPFRERDHLDTRGLAPQHLSLIQDVATPQAMFDAIERLRERVAERHPASELYSFCIQPMRRGRRSLSICTGVTQDAVFGPVIVFGLGGYRTDVLRDRQVALPPLNMALAAQLVERSQVYQLMVERLAGRQGRLEESIQRLCRLLVTLSQMCADLPHMRGLEINPLVLEQDELVAIDYALDFGEPVRQAIRPYPEGLRETLALEDGHRVVLRPVRAEDAALIERFHARLSPQSIRFRYFQHKAVLSRKELAQLASIDYDREMAFVLERHEQPRLDDDQEVSQAEDGSGEMLGVVRLNTDSDNLRTEFSVIVRDDLQRGGIGRRLMEKAIDYARDTGVLEMHGRVMADNMAMRGLLERLGFSLRLDMEEQVIIARLSLNPPEDAWQRLRLETSPG
ncbi:bifunctional acetate--CoA ligase family protein/GNAT family N-acetyltransferase [Halotalea alkalilenta]|uniref:bifunctional acetate--CoA ligase family protein/GNAT family N-acetyltransferase n=1 Tax=Halotalea alkalilenta TaxID=376489 RepID=UPI001FE1AB13|nr:GNAT family N-acetyltransferase [Halotalea alkalilenta]